MFPSPPRSTLFPYTTLFRSLDGEVRQIASERSELVKESDRLRQSLREAEIVDYRRVDFHGEKVLPAERSEEHTSELQSHSDLVCRLLLEKKKKRYSARPDHT